VLEVLSGSDPRFKTVRFAPGLNVALAIRTRKAASKASRNAVGKSSVVALIDFLLGAEANRNHLTRRPEIQDQRFTLRFDTQSGTHEVTRSGEDQGNPLWDGVTTDLENMRLRLAREFFGLTAHHTDAPSYRSLMAFYLRDREAGGFEDPLRTFRRATNLATYPALAYLLSLDQDIVKRAVAISDSRKNIKALRAAARDPLIGNMADDLSEVDAEIATMKLALEDGRRGLADFKVVDRYEDQRRRADALSREIRRLNDEATILTIREHDLAEAMAAAHAGVEPDLDYLPAVYEQVGVALPKVALRPLSEVREFHESIVRNRRAYLESELVDVRALVKETVERIRVADAERAEAMQLLREGGALETYSALQSEVAVAEGRLTALLERRSSLQALTDTSKHLKQKSVELERSARSDLVDRAEHLEEISSLFTRLAFEIYGAQRPAALTVQATTGGYKISPTLGGERSAGVAAIALFCFDMTMTVVAHRHGRGPDFMVHDSHLFDSVEERQIALALQAAEALCRAEGMQYIVTMNSDVFEQALSWAPDLDFHQAVTLTDEYEGGGLFGIRFN